MSNAIDRDFTFASLLRFAFPSIVMMVFLSLYTIVDGFFISRFVGSNALSATHIIFPVINVELAVGIMLATGGSAVVARRMGMGEEEHARQDFTLIVLAGLAASAVFLLLGLFAVEPISLALGASEALLPYCVDYLRILMLFAPAYFLQNLYQSFFVAAGRPGLGLGLTLAAGVANMVLDYVFIVPLDMGISGAAWATVIGYCIPAVVGTAFFALRRHGLRFARPHWAPRMLLHCCGNGSSEMVTNLANAVVTFLFNYFMLRFLGEDGVAAITIVLYAQFLLTALYMGFSMGVAPVISFSYGAENLPRLRRVFRSCAGFIVLSSVAIFGLALAFAPHIVSLFSPAGTPVYALAEAGFRLFSPAFLFAGVNIFSSALFTALSDGKTSALISFLRTFGFLLLGLLLLPLSLEADGVWMAVPFAEVLSCAVSLVCLFRGRRRYHYA